ncbi:MAG: insulinase family protein [Candidatus Zixiibacteriota bacterium]|nr:MAG: insulinase family protein [candidate division Zixibacteria bacterium]
MSKSRLSLMICAFMFLTTLTWAQSADVQLDVKKHTLANGLRVLVLENHSAPVFSSIIRFNTGSVDEYPGITGSSHLLEHMLFKGTRIVGTSNYEAEVPIMAKIDSLAHLAYAEQVKLQSPLNPPDSTRLRQLRQQMADAQAEQKQYVIKDELWGTYLQNGGSMLNASTGNDGTQYYVSLPKNRLELWAFLESDRMANLVLREFYSERDVVMEERRLSRDNTAQGRLGEATAATVNWASSYGWPVIGWMSDLQTVLREDVEQYFKSHYSPSNAVAVIVGDVNADSVFAICDKYFGKIPPQPLPRPVVTRDAPQGGERRVEVEYDANPMASICWQTPQIGHPDLPALDVAANILSNGRTSRFYKNIREKKLGTAGAYVDYSRYPGTFSCDVSPYGDHTTQELETAVYAEIDRMKNEKVTEWELQRVRNQVDARLWRSMDSNRGLASRIANSEIVTGDWRDFLNRSKAVKAVTADDVMRVVNKYLVKKNRSVVSIVRPEGEQPAAAAPRKNK